MFGSVGFQEILLILVIAFIVFGPKRLPEIGRSLGKGLREFKRSTSGLVDSLNDEVQKPVSETPATPQAPKPATAPPPSPQSLVQNPANPAPSDQVEEVVIDLDQEAKK